MQKLEKDTHAMILGHSHGTGTMRPYKSNLNAILLQIKFRPQPVTTCKIKLFIYYRKITKSNIFKMVGILL